MSKFAVTVEDAEYEVEAPDEATAWKYANIEHQKVQPLDVNPSVAAAMNVGQALTFGFGDEIASKFGIDKSRYNKTIKNYQEEYPISSMLGSVSGSMLLPFGAAKAPVAAASPWMTAATVGLGQGALQGAGDAPTVSQTPGMAAMGGLSGAVAAPLAMMGLGIGGNVLGALGSKFGPQKWADDVARRRIATAFERDSTTAEDVGRNMVRLGPEARVADAAGENTRGVLDLNATMPGKTKNLLDEAIKSRQATRPERMDEVVYTVNGGVGRGSDMIDALTNQRRQVAAPLYQKAHAQSIMPSNDMVQDLDAVRKMGAFKEAQDLALLDRSNGPFTLDQQQQVLGKGKISVRDIDHIKQGIDTLIDKETDALTGKMSQKGAKLVALKQRMLSEVDGQVGDYKAARAAYAGPMALETAIKKGRAFWSEDADSLTRLMNGMTDSEQAAFRVGAADKLRTMVGERAGQNKLLDVWVNRNTREKLQALLGDDVKYADVKKFLDGEGTLKRMERLGRGSQTAGREFGATDQGLEVASDLASMGMDAKAGSWGVLAGKLKPMMRGEALTPESVRDAIGKILLQQYQPAEMKALQQAQEVIKRQRALASSSIGGASGQAGAYGTGLLDD